MNKVWIYKRKRIKGWWVVDVEMASRIQHGQSLDQSRRRPTVRLAAMDEKI
ncbi:MAG: hypothetical protein HQ580_03805 [Planctomycetes bacterium]|nr:hypothetical protein [Planctomycetota bacterium]